MALQERTDHPSHSWTPRPPLDPMMRMRFYGPIRPMEKPNLLERLFRHR